MLQYLISTTVSPYQRTYKYVKSNIGSGSLMARFFAGCQCYIMFTHNKLSDHFSKFSVKIPYFQIIANTLTEVKVRCDSKLVDCIIFMYVLVDFRIAVVCQTSVSSTNTSVVYSGIAVARQISASHARSLYRVLDIIVVYSLPSPTRQS